MTELWATFGKIATMIVLINADFCICLRLSSNFEDENSRKMKQSSPFKLILLLSLVVYSIGGFCQQIPTINLVMKDGLSSNYVTDITQDKYGFTWFATKYGLNRFDGDKNPIKNCLIATILIKLLQTLLIIRYGLPTDGWE